MTLQQEIAAGMTNANNADAETLRRVIVRTEVYLMNLKARYGELTGGDRVSHADVLEEAAKELERVPVLTLDAPVMPAVDLMLDRSQIDELLIEDAAVQAIPADDVQMHPEDEAHLPENRIDGDCDGLS